MPDFVVITDNDGAHTRQGVVQVWCDPKRPDVHRDPRLREYLSRRAEEGLAAVIRFSDRDAFVLFAPHFTGGEWFEMRSAMASVEHTPQEIVSALGEGWELLDLSKGAAP